LPFSRGATGFFGFGLPTPGLAPPDAFLAATAVRQPPEPDDARLPLLFSLKATKA
jgi:hypothetical protein